MSHRLFVGADPPPGVRDRLRALQGGLEGARWVPPENLHLTLRFIGEVERRQANDIAEELAAVRAPRLELGIEGAGVFGKGRRPRALWAGVAPSPALRDLKRRVDAACARAGVAPEARRFAPHVTLARLAGAAADAAERHAARIAAVAEGAFPVTEIVLFESRLGAEAPHYTRVARYALDSPPDAA